jgi:NTE family protein
MSGLDQLRSHRIGLALSGGSVRGIAHIGVAKALADYGIRPSIITGTSAGSLVGAALAAGMSWRQIEQMAQSIFWPRLLHGRTLERFCSKYLPGTFAELEIPFIAIATELPARRVLAIAEGNLASAISASCAMPGVRRAVNRAGKQLKDGGITCVLPSAPCRSLGAEFIIAADVWEVSSLLNEMGIGPDHRWARAPTRRITTRPCGTPISSSGRASRSGYFSGPQAIQRMIAAGEQAAKQALDHIQQP